MVSAIIHLANKDYASLVDDFISLQILPADCNRQKVMPCATARFRMSQSAFRMPQSALLCRNPHSYSAILLPYAAIRLLSASSRLQEQANCVGPVLLSCILLLPQVVPLMDKALSPYVKGGGAKTYESEIRKTYRFDEGGAVGGFQVT